MWKISLGLVVLCFGTTVGFAVGIIWFGYAGMMLRALVGATGGGGLGVYTGSVLDKRAREDAGSRSASHLVGVALALSFAVVTVLLVLWWMGWII